MIKKYISFAAASTVVLAPLVLAAPTHAAVVAPAKTLYACQKKKTGALRIVKKSKKCKKSEKKISWNTKGPKGDKGDIGNPGAPGPGATPFSASLVTVNTALSTVDSDPIAVGGLELRFRCLSFLSAAGSSPRVTSPTAATFATRGVWLNNWAIQDGAVNNRPLQDTKDGNLAAGSEALVSQWEAQTYGVNNIRQNFGVVNTVVTNSSGKYLITYAASSLVQVAPNPASPKAYCEITGWWSKLS